MKLLGPGLPGVNFEIGKKMLLSVGPHCSANDLAETIDKYYGMVPTSLHAAMRCSVSHSGISKSAIKHTSTGGHEIPRRSQEHYTCSTLISRRQRMNFPVDL